MVDLSPLITALTTSITPVHIVTVLASFIGIGMTFVLMWFGIRKLVSIFRGAAMGGSLFSTLEAYGRYQYFRHKKGWNSTKSQSFRQWYNEDQGFYG